MGGDKGPMGGVLPHPPPILDNPDMQAEIFKTNSELLINNRLSVLDYVGVIRSPSGNLPNLLNRFRCHNRALGAILSSGLARKHRANPAAALQAYNIHCVPVLMSGLSCLVLKPTEINSISQHHKKKLLLIQKLPTGTPDPVVYFLSGSLPGRAILHLRQLSNFGMITHLSDNPIYKIAMRMLTTAKPSSSSWFLQIRDLCLQYSLPHPLVLLKNPIPKAKYKTLIKKCSIIGIPVLF